MDIKKSLHSGLMEKSGRNIHPTKPFDLENKYDEVEKGTIASGQ